MTAVVILAAGSSTRMGSPKQNLNYKGKSLLQFAIQNALTISKTVLVVLGANRDEIEFSIKDQPIGILYNTAWTEGMASSVKMGIEKLQTDYLQVDAVLLMVCDQPYADANILQKLVAEAETIEKGIVAAAYNNVLGVPVIFKKSYFPYLIALKGHEGAKNLLTLYADDVTKVPFPMGGVDIDTVEDWENLEQG